MTLESQVVSLELAQKLKELGVTAPSAFRWFSWNYVRDEWENCVNVEDEETGGFPRKELCNAYSVAELGEMLPAFYASWRLGDKTPEEHRYVCMREGDEEGVEVEYAKTEADCRTKLIIYLLENKLITL